MKPKVKGFEGQDLIKLELKLEADKPLPVYKVGANVTPKLIGGKTLTGYGVIISVKESKYNVIYKVLTDFGNVVTLEESNLHKHYEVSTEEVMISLSDRIQIQINLLTDVQAKLKEGYYND